MPGPAPLKRLSLRARLLLGFLLVLGLVGAVGIPTGLSFISRTLRDEAMRRVEIDLGAAWAAFEAERGHIQTVLSLVGQGQPIRAALLAPAGGEALAADLEVLRRRHELDILTVVDASGRVLLRSRSPYRQGDALERDPVVRRALAGQAASGAILVDADDLRAKGDELAERAYLPLVYTERAVPTERTAEDRGLVLEAALPILDPAGGVRGALVGGILLNRKFELVDRIRNTVFGDRTYAGKPVGTVTLFLGDVRIATNVMLDAGTRALGTRVSREVAETVLDRGERFADRAFVVNDWYLSAYDPLRDPEGRVVGIIYVGLLEKAYLQYRGGLAREYLAISLFAVLLSIVAALVISSSLRRPVARLVAATRQIAEGKLDVRVPEGRGSQEMVELAQAFNSMAETARGGQAKARGGGGGSPARVLGGGRQEPGLPGDAGLRDPRAEEPAGLDRLRHRLAAGAPARSAHRGPGVGAALVGVLRGLPAGHDRQLPEPGPARGGRAAARARGRAAAAGARGAPRRAAR